MENKDLKFIKKQYGEDFMHLCRTLFPTILEKEGMLSDIISSKFAPSNSLYEDLTLHEGDTLKFKSFIFDEYNKIVNQKDEIVYENSKKTPEELLDEAGYILYPECKTEEEIQSFRKYWEKDEELCTFKYGNRLRSCRVWFAIKKNIDEIKREDFTSPQRQDEYGTSAISIQFTRGEISTLSIKNRYNHTVINPDATFSNNLDNIIAGLSDSFAKTYEINFTKNDYKEFEPINYVRDKSGKFYKYIREVNNVYYCENNIVLRKSAPISYDKSRYIVFENYILDLKDKCFIDPLDTDDMAFIDSIGEIESISVLKGKNHERTIVIKPKSDKDKEIFDVKIKLNRRNQIIGYYNENVTRIEDNFLKFAYELKEIDMPNVKTIGDDFLNLNFSLTKLNLPNLEVVRDGFLSANISLETISLPKVENIGSGFLESNKKISKVDLPNVKIILSWFLTENNTLKEIDLPNLEYIASYFLANNNSIETINLPKVKKVFNEFLKSNNKISKVNLPKLRVIGNEFLASNNAITELDIPKAWTIGDNFLRNNYNTLETISLPNVEQIGNDFIKCNENLKNLYLPSLKYVGKGMLENNTCLENACMPNYTLEKLEKLDIAKYHPNRKNLLQEIDTINKKYIKYNQKQTNNDNDDNEELID